jgi:hypothetical protein
MKLEFLMEYHADLKPPVGVGPGPSGRRQIYEVTGGSFEGPKLRGTIETGGGDWLLIGADGVGRLDVRATLRTHDGALIYMQYHGVIDLPGLAARQAPPGGRGEYGDIYFMTAPRFETGDERYAWLNAVIAVGEGRSAPGAVEYRVYQAVNG